MWHRHTQWSEASIRELPHRGSLRVVQEYHVEPGRKGRGVLIVALDEPVPSALTGSKICALKGVVQLLRDIVKRIIAFHDEPGGVNPDVVVERNDRS